MRNMARFLLRRFVFVCFLIIGVTFLVFMISHLVPSDPIASNMSPNAMSDPAAVAAYKARWGLDKPLMEQYFIYLSNLLRGDLGISIRTGNPVISDLKQFFPATLELSIMAMLIAVLFGITFGIISAVYRNKPFDYLVRTISISGVSIPNFWFALVMLLLFYSKWRLFPGGGRVSSRVSAPTGGTGLYVLDALTSGNWALLNDALSHLILPAIVLGFFTMGLISRQTRSNLLEVSSLDYIRTAKAKGLSQRQIVLRHALGNALIPVITVMGMGFSNLLGGMVFVEKIFSWPGIGQYAYLSATTLDFPAICGVSLLIAMINVVLNLFIDILYGVIDPRVRYS
ncbi:ABC transporter permease [Enterococcus gilvus]|jgi:peptide/nickel transport system permease protein|uniref:ABC transporter permease n=2 Tax=Enterococcus gilvus TaxID=160453 RepID=UPI000DF61E0A|nr:ABC transporter permease [Enterococcus gilvus]AXG39031.1 ABC transporter permease [Enterococcus gilvus]